FFKTNDGHSRERKRSSIANSGLRPSPGNTGRSMKRWAHAVDRRDFSSDDSRDESEGSGETRAAADGEGGTHESRSREGTSARRHRGAAGRRVADQAAP